MQALQWAVARAGKKEEAPWACREGRPFFRRSGTTVRGRVAVRALQDKAGGLSERRGRLVDVVRRIPAAVDKYFDKSPFRRALWGGISLLGGFYVAQTISLSFGALGVNDVIAAALCVLFTEYVTRFYYTRPTPPSFYVALLNNFKMGFSYGLFIDAFKLAS